MKDAIIAEAAKLVDNTAFRRTGMNKNKFKNVKCCIEEQSNKVKNNYFYYDGEEYNGVYEVTKRSKRVLQNMPIAYGLYDDSKLRMLQFYYDCIDKYTDRSDFQYLQMDTGSVYMTMTDDFENIIKLDLKDKFEKNKYKWFITDQYSNMTPGLFKMEYEGEGMVALCSEIY